MDYQDASWGKIWPPTVRAMVNGLLDLQEKLAAVDAVLGEEALATLANQRFLQLRIQAHFCRKADTGEALERADPEDAAEAEEAEEAENEAADADSMADNPQAVPAKKAPPHSSAGEAAAEIFGCPGGERLQSIFNELGTNGYDLTQALLSALWCLRRPRAGTTYFQVMVRKLDTERARRNMGSKAYSRPMLSGLCKDILSDLRDEMDAAGHNDYLSGSWLLERERLAELMVEAACSRTSAMAADAEAWCAGLCGLAQDRLGGSTWEVPLDQLLDALVPASGVPGVRKLLERILAGTPIKVNDCRKVLDAVRLDIDPLWQAEAAAGRRGRRRYLMTANRIKQLRLVDEAVHGLAQVCRNWRDYPVEVVDILGAASVDDLAVRRAIKDLLDYARNPALGACRSRWLLTWSERHAGLALSSAKRNRRRSKADNSSDDRRPLGPLHRWAVVPKKDVETDEDSEPTPGDAPAEWRVARSKAFEDIKTEEDFEQAIDDALRDLARFAAESIRHDPATVESLDAKDPAITDLASPGRIEANVSREREKSIDEEIFRQLSSYSAAVAKYVIYNSYLEVVAGYWERRLNVDQRLQQCYPKGISQAEWSAIVDLGEKATDEFNAHHWQDSNATDDGTSRGDALAGERHDDID